MVVEAALKQKVLHFAGHNMDIPVNGSTQPIVLEYLQPDLVDFPALEAVGLLSLQRRKLD